MSREVPRIPGGPELLVGPPATHSKLDGMGLPQHDHARRNHLLHQGGGRGRAAVVPGPTAPCGHAARDLDEILHRHRDAVERADAMARRHGGRRGVRRGPGLVGVDIDVRVELRIITGDAVQVALDDFYRGDLTLRHTVTQLVHRLECEWRLRRHGQSPSLRSASERLPYNQVRSAITLMQHGRRSVVEFTLQLVQVALSQGRVISEDFSEGGQLTAIDLGLHRP